LAADDVGLVPWLPLTRFTGEPERLLRQCRERIERQTDFRERANLLAVTQVFSRLRFPSPKLLEILGGSKVMAESPLIQELVAEKLQIAILGILEERFQTVPSDLAEQVRAVTREKKLNILIRKASVSRNLEAFRDFLLTQ
jgi:predicted transposase YdaD